MHASLREIKNGYKGLKHLVKEYVKAGDYSSAMNYINHCTTIASQFNWIYSDDELESILDTISQSVINIDDLNDYQSEKDNWVFYDDYCTSYVLALQWMTALSKTGRNILYITSQYSFENRRDKSILPEIERMPNVTVTVIQDGSIFERSNALFQSIIRFKASKVILHKAMNSLIQLPLCVLPREITVYNINLGDQFFWLGARHIDYNIEFRPFGASVSLQRRGFKKEQLFMIPFYPANENRPFEGFPKECDDRVVIFSGGDFYKTCDKNDTFWGLIKEILNKHPNVVFLFATKRRTTGSEVIHKFIKENHFDNRFFYIDYRQDIYQVFAHCDIYMGTTPISGSLMSQLAAINEKPILQYYTPGTPDDETEQAICINDKFHISFTSKDDFLYEADMLINNINYRIKQGKKLKTAIIQPNQFNRTVYQTLDKNESVFRVSFVNVNYCFLDQRWLMQEEYGFTDSIPFLYSLLGWKYSLLFSPTLFLKKNLKRLFSHEIHSS